ncbi:MAG: SDR family oxidoreductase [archaeon]
MKVAVIGASGNLGNCIASEFSKGHSVVGTYHKSRQAGLLQLDITDRKAVMAFIGMKRPRLVIHADGITDVNHCDAKPEHAESVNVDGTANLIEACKLTGSKLIYVSTDFVFDGKKGGYSEEDAPHPVNVYGRTKLDSEKLIIGSGLDYLIARTAVLYGAYADPKFVRFVIEKLKKNEKISIVTDHIRTPTLVDDVASALVRLRTRTGLFHVAGPVSYSMHEMACIIAGTFGFDRSLIYSIESSALTEAAPKPKDTSLNTGKIRQLGIRMRDFESGLKGLQPSVEKT